MDNTSIRIVASGLLLGAAPSPGLAITCAQLVIYERRLPLLYRSLPEGFASDIKQNVTKLMGNGLKWFITRTTNLPPFPPNSNILLFKPLANTSTKASGTRCSDKALLVVLTTSTIRPVTKRSHGTVLKRIPAAQSVYGRSF
jgi:hypothetical protein